MKKTISMILCGALLFTGCSSTAKQSNVSQTEQTEAGTKTETQAEAETTTTEDSQTADETTDLAKIDASKWNYNSDDNVYWQVGISYCANPAAEEYETLGIFVPGGYMTAADNGDGTYTCELNSQAAVGKYTSQTAPVVIPVNTPGYSAMAAPADYVNGVSDYTDAGFVYVSAGCRGRDAGAPAGVTDLKAAIRYIRYHDGEIPGSMDRIFSFGMSGGGAQSALLGATGDSELYTPYLEAIGAVDGVSDAVAGSMCWCPITNLDYADEAYEWNLGVTRSGLDDDMQQLSDSMAEAFAQYINDLGLTDADGQILTLTQSEDGIYQAGSYYDYLKSVIETSLNHFLEDTEFPYEATGGSGMQGGGGRGMGGRDFADGELPDGGLPDKDFQGGNLPNGGLPDKDFQDGNLPDGELPDKDFQGGNLPDKNAQGNDLSANDAYGDNINRNETDSGLTLSGTYETAQDYIDALNAETTWVSYDSQTNTATITSIANFVKAFKNASKNVGAFDDLDETQGENELFGYGDGSGAHFDAVMAELLKDNETYGSAYAEDLTKEDALGNTVDYRLNMYNPMYYLDDYYEGYKSSQTAKYWRIRSGINQSDTALTTEVNLALALEAIGADVDFETVWEQGHTEAERSGDSTTNFIEWVNECLN